MLQDEEAACQPCSSSGQEQAESVCLAEAQDEEETLYERLGVDVNASISRIRASYMRLARLWHPDRHKGEAGDFAKARFQSIAHAYEVLSDESLRAHYDLGLLDRLAVEDYLHRYQNLVLTVSGLGLASRTSSECSASWDAESECLLLTQGEATTIEAC